MGSLSTKFTALVMAALVALSAFGSGMVLCVGVGHVCIESSVDDQCQAECDDDHDVAGDVAYNSQCEEQDADCCDECVDIPLPELETGVIKLAEKTRPVSRQISTKYVSVPSDYTSSSPAALRIELQLFARQVNAQPDAPLALRI